MSEQTRLDALLLRYEELRAQGTVVSPEELCQDCPELLDQLKQQLRELESINAKLDAASEDASADRTRPDRSRPGLAMPWSAEAVCTSSRYQILRFHAKGGLGEVHLARDEQLHREVALKRLQTERASNPQNRDRFLREAAITSRLEHPSIVPVHSMGQDTDGCPFYAMRFIQGQTLQEAIEQFHSADAPGRTPGERHLALRQLLGRMVAVCNTLAYAHSKGIVHRDVKPANIMLGPYGETLVVDWGLAKEVGARESEIAPAVTASETGDPSLVRCQVATETGMVLGTPTYMSPEQASGRRELVSPTSDVYSLGVTLYTVLTGEPPFRGRHVVEVLDQVKRGEFPAPRQRNQAIPRALEAICLKAMARQPEGRYAGALDMAADLEHWLADEPVSAWREPFTVRLRRWLDRHRTAVAAAAALLLAAVVSLAISTVLIRQREQAAQSARQQAEQQRDRADYNLRLARKAVDNTVSKITVNPRLKEADFHQLRRELLESMVPFYEEFVKRRENDPDLETERGRTWGSLADLRTEMGEKERALSDYQQVRALFAQLTADFPAVPEYRQYLARSHSNLGLLLQDLGKRVDAETACREALKIQAQLAHDFPAVPHYRQELALSHANLGNLLRDLGKGVDAEIASREALKIQTQLAQDFPAVCQYRHELAGSHNNLGILLRALGKRAEAESAYREALKIRAQLAQDFPAVSQYRRELATSHNNLGSLLADLGKGVDAETAFRDALKIFAQLLQAFPAVPQYRQDLAGNHNNLGILLVELGKRAEAESAYREALKIRAQLAQEFPAVPEYRQNLAQSHHNLGVLLHQLGKQADAESAYREALKVRAQLAQDFPAVSQYRQELATSHSNLGALLGDLGKRADAETVFCEALKIRAQLAQDFPTVPGYRQDLATSHYNWGILLAALGKRADAESAYREALKIQAQLAQDFPSVRQYRQGLAQSHHNMGVLLHQLGKQADAETAFRDALKIQARLAKDFPTVLEYQYELAATLLNLAIIVRRGKDPAQARQLLEQAVPHHRAALKANARNPEYRASLRANCQALVLTLLDLGDHTAAAEAAEQLIRAAVDPARDVYNAACYVARCVPLAEDDAKLTASQRQERAQAYADRALATLRQAVQNGYKNAAHMKKDTDLDPLRSREDFQKLLKELERKVATGAK